MNETIGTYIDRVRGKTYTVEKHTHEISHRQLDGSIVFMEGSYEYKTSCGYSVEPRSDDLSTFELIEIDGIIHLSETSQRPLKPIILSS